MEYIIALLKEEKLMELQHLPFTLVPSIQMPHKLELKELSSHSRYAYLEENSTLSVIISSLIGTKKKKLPRVL